MDKHYETKVLILRRLLKLNATERTRNPSRILELVDRLSDLLDRHGDHQESARLYMEHISTYPEFRSAAITLNSQALQWRDAEQPEKAEPLLRKALAIEKQVLSPDSGKHPHRINNLAGVLIMLGKLEEAENTLKHAWNLMGGKHDTTSVRILINQTIVCILNNQSCGPFISILKWLLYDTAPGVDGNITSETKAGVIVDYLEARLEKDETAFLHTLVRAANDYNKVRELEIFPLWNNYPATLPHHNPSEEMVDDR